MEPPESDDELAQAAARLREDLHEFAPSAPTDRVTADRTRSGRLRPRRHEVAITVVLVVVVVALIAIGMLRRDDLASRTRVAVIGDSLTMQSSWAIDDALGADGYVVAVSGRNGATVGDQYDQAISYTGFDGAEVLVVALGTNNAYYLTVDDDRHVSSADTSEEIDTLVHDVQLGPPDRSWEVSVRCLVWVNLREDTTGFTLDAQAPPINAEIAAHLAEENAAGRPMRLADWATRSRGRDEWFIADGVHLNADGQAAYAELIAETVASCGS